MSATHTSGGRGAGRPCRLACLQLVLVLLAVGSVPVLIVGCSVTVIDPATPDNPKERVTGTRTIIITKGDEKDSDTQTVTVSWNPDEQTWEEIEVPEPGLGKRGQAVTTSSPGGGPTQQAIRLPSLALFTGGGAGSGTFASTTAMLYDHNTEEWTALSMLQTRVGHTMTTLLDGRILIAGGWDGDVGSASHVYLNSAELFDPADQSFKFTGSMVVGREAHAAALLPDGRVLITGGDTEDTMNLGGTHAEIYDPATGTFSPTGSMLEPRRSHTATSLDDGRVLIVGSDMTRSAEVFDPGSGTFLPVGSTTGYHGFGATATKLLDGRVLIVGGRDLNFDPTAIVELFDPASDTFTALTPLRESRSQHTAVLAGDDGTVLICGGWSGDSFDPTMLASCVLFDPATDTFLDVEDMPQANADGVGVYVERAE